MSDDQLSNFRMRAIFYALRRRPLERQPNPPRACERCGQVWTTKVNPRRKYCHRCRMAVDRAFCAAKKRKGGANAGR